MSYHYWTTNGFGFCVDDIHTTPKRLMELAAMNKKVLRRVEEYLNEEHPGWTIESLNMEDFKVITEKLVWHMSFMKLSLQS